MRSTGTSKPEIKDTCRKDEPRSRPRTELLVTSSVHDKDDQSVDGATSSSIDTDMSFPDSLPDLPSTRAHDIITGLFELGPTLLDPAPHDRLEESIHPGAAQHDLDHVRAKFPRADESLIQRLGLANWERRVYLRKLRLVHEEHRDHTKTAEMFKTAEDLSQTDAASISESSEADICSSSDAASRASSHGYPGSKKPPSMTASLNLTATASTRSDFHFSTNETRSTARTDITQHIASKHDIPDRTTSTKYVMPPPPCPNQNYTGEDFLCPYCFRVVPDVKSSLEWK